MALNNKEIRAGWEWKDVGNGNGYWVKIDSKSRHLHKIDFFCPHCKKITGTIDDECLVTYGFCKTCYVLHVEERKEPTIDLEFYKNRLKG